MNGKWASIERFASSRLLFEPLAGGHAAELSVMLRGPRVAKTLWPRDEPPTEADVIQNLRAKVEHWQRHGFGFWLLRDRETGAMVGRGGLQHTYSAELQDIEVGWAIVPERWGQGLATEMARAALEVAFSRLELLEVVAFTLPDNRASRRVMEKTGLRYEREFTHAGLPHVLYRLPASAWRAARAITAA